MAARRAQGEPRPRTRTALLARELHAELLSDRIGFREDVERLVGACVPEGGRSRGIGFASVITDDLNPRISVSVLSITVQTFSTELIDGDGISGEGTMESPTLKRSIGPLSMNHDPSSSPLSLSH
jgi:hypothetical protein